MVDPGAPTADLAAVTLDKPVLFESGTAEIDPAYIPLLEACGDVLLLNPHITMSVAAFTDSTGPADFNLALSQQRAQAILDFYRELDIGDDQLVGIGYGEDRPVADNETDEGRAEHRRAMLALLGVMGEKVDPEDGQPADGEPAVGPPTTLEPEAGE